jgi:hypothetical protein
VSGVSVDYRGALEAVDRILNRGGDADDVLRAVLEALHARGVPFGAVRLVEGERLVDGPTIGMETAGIEAAVVFEGARVGTLELAVDEPQFVERVATLISSHVNVRARRAPAPPSSK